MSNGRPRHGSIRRGNLNRGRGNRGATSGLVNERGRGTRGAISGPLSERGRSSVEASSLRGSSGGADRRGGRRGGSIPRGGAGRPNRPPAKKWCVLVMNEAAPDAEITDFVLGLRYKLEATGFVLSPDNQITLKPKDVTDAELSLYRIRNGDCIEFCLILLAPSDRQAEIDDQLKRTYVRRIFIKKLDDDGICKAAREVRDLKSEENGSGVPDLSEDESSTRPMSEQKLHNLAVNAAISDEEILMKLIGDGSFARRLMLPTNRLDILDVLILISRATNCNAEHYRRSFNQLLEELCSSTFWKETLSRKLAEIQSYSNIEVQRNQHTIKKILIYTISIVVEILQSVESKARDTLIIKVILSSILKMVAIRKNAFIFDEDLARHESSLDTVWHDVVEVKGTPSLRPTLVVGGFANSTDERPPPNNFRELTIFPSEDEILTTVKPYLRPNKTKGAYDSMEHYLDVQFRLLREDYIDPLRKGINSVLNVKDTNKRPEIKIYEKVRVSPPVQNKRTGLLTYKLTFDVSHMKKVRWEISKRFLHGSLICLSSDNFKTMLFATIDDRKAEELKKGQLDVVFELLPDNRLSYKDEYRMVESSVYFEAYRHVLLALSAIKDERHMPFPKYFIQCNPNVDSPLYLRAINSELDLTCLVKNNVSDRNYSCNILRQDTWPSKEILDFDQSQYDALKLALTKELAIIQGPPGTGKTFIGYKITEVLLSNYKRWQDVSGSNSPILVVCYTNHALDQFLEGITEFTNEKIIRIGGRSKSEKMERFLLKNIKSEYDMPKDLRYRLRDEYSKKSVVEKRIADIAQLMTALDKSPLNHLALREIVRNDRILGQIFSNPKKLNVNKDRLLNIWLTNKTQIQNERSAVDLHALRDLMNASEMGQVPCMNALFWTKGDFDKAYILLLKQGNNPIFYQPVAELANIPDLSAVDEIISHASGSFDEQDAIFALQQNGHDICRAMQWLTDCSINVQNENLDELATERAIAEMTNGNEEDYELLLDDLEDENRLLDDDADDEIEDRFEKGQLILDDRFEPVQAIQDWNIVSKGGKSQFPQSVWKVIMKSKPYSDAEYEHFANNATHVIDAWKLSMPERWRLYRTWLEKFRMEKDNEIRNYQKHYFEINQQIKEIRSLELRHIFEQAKVLGMTTTGAARYQSVLNGVKPKIVIIEEAAEVLESHIVTSLSAGCQHVVLIGDHFQLRPSPAVYELAKKYEFDVSLFERLINNNFEHAVLKQQHRMRPEIANSLMPYFYDGLINHPSVEEYESVKGVTKNLYFFHHTRPEKQEGDSTSRQNEFEAQMIVGMSKYLLQQGYEPSKITILCCYAGQMFCIKKLMKRYLLEEELKSLRVTVVDNYQGEECDIILLSFVRSNNENKIGFLKTKNRVCVALSRAKIGLYCFGNFDLLSECAPELWGEIIETVKKQSMYGQHLPLICQIHKNVAAVKVFEDFCRLVPEGGCRKLCNFRLDCGHVCKKCCHPDDHDHKKIRCVRPCQRTCPEGHPCRKLCWEDCGKCTVAVEKILPVCGHTNKVPCYKPVDEIRCQLPCARYLLCGHKCQETCDPIFHTKNCKEKVMKNLPCGHRIESMCFQEVEEVKCTQKVEKTWPFCKHTELTLCSIDVTKEECKKSCSTTLECGHICQGNCITCRNGRLHVQCKETCTKILVCGHECGENCSASCPPCTKTCEIRCVHSSCLIQGNGKKQKGKGRRCGIPCPECEEACIWKCPHYECKKKCFEPCDRPRCNEKCIKKLKCGHDCIGVCDEICPKVCVQCDPKKYAELKEIFFGHEDELDARFLQLPDCGHIFEVGGFDSYMDECLRQSRQSERQSEIKLLDCPKCRKPILTCLRYSNALKLMLADVQNVKRKIQGNLIELDERRKILINDISREIELVKVSDTENAGFAFCELFKTLRSYLKNHKIQHLTIEKIARITNMINFLSQLVELQRRIDEKFSEKDANCRESKISHLFFRSRLLALSKSFVVSSPILLSFLQFWFKSCIKHEDEEPYLSTELINKYLSDGISKLFRWTSDSYKNASKQMMNEFMCELQRFRLLIEVIGVVRLAVEKKAEVTSMNDIKVVMEILNGSNKMDENLEKKCERFLESFNKSYNLTSSLGISDTERKEILKAMNMRQGHWFKCKNGHVYCITECGGAMQEANCPECNEIIGGTAHRLRAGNRVASEMDGASRSAYDAAADINEFNLGLIRRLQLGGD